MNKQSVNIAFIIVSGIVLFFFYRYNWLDNYSQFIFIPILIAYFVGQYVERKYGLKDK